MNGHTPKDEPVRHSRPMGETFLAGGGAAGLEPGTLPRAASREPGRPWWSHALRRRPHPALVASFVLPVVVLVAAYGRDWHLPGLYMDAINPEYLIPGILHPPAPLVFAIPGNLVDGRFPVFTGIVYHGSTQLYAALPFLAAFGSTLFTFRTFELLVGGAILVLALSWTAAGAPGPRRPLAVGVAGLLALDPAFVLDLRTQAYSCMFPLVLLLVSVLLLRRWRRGRWPWVRIGLAGALYGLAVFSYFIFGFFAPAVVWLLLRNPDGDQKRNPAAVVGVWLAGCLIGYLPFICGIVLLRHALGGTSQLLDWLRASSDQLGTTRDTSGLPTRLQTVYTQSRQVLTGEWPWLMILGRHRTGLFESLKADMLVLVPLGVLLVPKLASQDRRRIVVAPLALVASFALGGLVFGARLGGHHYTAILPLVYVTFGLACAALLPYRWESGWRGLWATPADAARSALVVVAAGVVGFTSLFAQLDFHRLLLATGGVKWYSNAIDLFARDLDRTTPGATVYTPDWGYSMPVAFLTTASPIKTTVDPAEIHVEGCAGKAQLVVFDGAANQAKARLIARLSRRPLDRLTTWSRRDGVPVFQVAKFGTAQGCPPPRAARRPQLRITPAATPACPFLAQTNVRTVTWSVRDPRHHGVELLVQPPGGKPSLWIRGGGTGTSTSGPWAVPGMAFILHDAVTHRSLAQTTVGQAAACPAS